MSKPTKKKNPKPVTKGDAKDDGVVTLKDGTVVKSGEAFTIDKDGNYRKSTEKEVAEATNAFITRKDMATGNAVTYCAKLNRCGNGNLLIGVVTADTIDDHKEMVDVIADKESDGYVTEVGRGNVVHAALAISTVAKAWLASFGQSDAYKMVRLTLEPSDKTWFGLFVPTMELM